MGGANQSGEYWIGKVNVPGTQPGKVIPLAASRLRRAVEVERRRLGGALEPRQSVLRIRVHQHTDGFVREAFQQRRCGPAPAAALWPSRQRSDDLEDPAHRG